VALLIGETKDRIATSIARASQRFRSAAVCETFDSLDAAVHAAHDKAKAGQVVLLSPACASFDQFKNADERGDRFQEVVRSLG
jgi:UDP-N-acetylmuramoylalanine--D-glutamate ligase